MNVGESPFFKGGSIIFIYGVIELKIQRTIFHVKCLVLPDFVVFILQAGENCIFAALLQ
jgi:hypothetical protein